RWIAMALVALTLICACTRTSLPPIVEAKRVFVIVMENHSYEEALQGAYTAELEKQAGVATNYHAITHPSVPNYLAITSGQTWGISEDTYRALPPEDIGHQMTSADIRWRAYMEGLVPGRCFDSPKPFNGDHDPFAYYGGRCPSNAVPFSELSLDLQTTSTRFSWIGPDSCHDQHDCSTAAGDNCLRRCRTGRWRGCLGRRCCRPGRRCCRRQPLGPPGALAPRPAPRARSAPGPLPAQHPAPRSRPRTSRCAM